MAVSAEVLKASSGKAGGTRRGWKTHPKSKSFVGTEFKWGDEERDAFRDLKQAITSAPVLSRPDFQKPFILAVDAYKRGLGGVLMQTDDAGHERPVLFISRQTTEGEKKYAPTHLGLAAVWWCVKKLLHYVDGSSVEIRTDHNALRWLWDLKPSEVTEPRVQKYKVALAPLEHKVQINYNRGKDNVVADALSWAPVTDRPAAEGQAELSFIAPEYEPMRDGKLEEQATATVRSVSVLRLGREELDSWAAAYTADPHWRRLWKKGQDRASTTEDAEEEMIELAGTVDAPEVPEDDLTASAHEEEEVTGVGTEPVYDPASAPDVAETLKTAPSRRETAPARRVLRPRRILAVHRGEDDALFFLKGGLIFSRAGDKVKLCVPKSKISTLIHEYHASIRSAHPSAERTYDTMKDHLFAHGLAQEVADHVRTFYECQVNKTRRHKSYGKMEPVITPDENFAALGIDFVTGFPRTARGFDSVMVVVCEYSRFVFFIPNATTDTATQVAIKFLEHVFPVTGLPKSIVSDRDSKFTSAFWSTLTASLGIKLAMSTAFHAQTNGLVERINAQMETMLRHYVSLDEHDWDTKLAALSMAYNAQRQESTGQLPYKMVFTRDPSIFPLRDVAKSADPSNSKVNDLFAIHADAQAAMEIARERQRRAYDSRHQELEFNVGESVLISLKNYRFDLDPTEQARAKLSPRFAGPFKVKKRIGRQAYELEIPAWFKAHPVLPITALEPFRGDAESVAPRPQVGTAADGGELESWKCGCWSFWDVDPRVFFEGDKFDYLVKWAGPAPTWQCDSRLEGLGWAQKEFERRARSELNLVRLRRTSPIILPEAKQRALDLAVVEEDTDAARTQGFSLGGEVVTDSQVTA
ncbi:hypothetical protein A4X09_0g7020 [Tilletia walkeri]|uniref:Integrase catalytic domain-containing protein n=1 Tax=Tilletia walkeri TaxID=117179 RepID=A0A8X7N2M1_9BASI|nr:hypothetical protein A4X09_0g7020 [Tilletia walkeri]